MNRLDAFTKSGDKAFVPYVTAGYPGKSETMEIMHLLVEAGADLIELGMPFSDPTADGPVIQAASQDALERGFRIDDYFEVISQFRSWNTVTPIVAFTYYNPVYHVGVDKFVKRLKDAGGDAMLVVDLPFEEQGELRPALDSEDMRLIQLIAPTTPDDRIAQIVERASGFVYQVALKGVTGVRDSLAAGAKDNALRTKSFTDVPVYMGFGVSNAIMASAVAAAADGVIVGSAIVKCIQDNLPNFERALDTLATSLAQATHEPGNHG